MKMHQGSVRFLVARGGVEHLEFDMSTKQASVPAVPVTAGHDDHERSPVTNRLRILPIPSIEASTTWPLRK